MNNKKKETIMTETSAETNSTTDTNDANTASLLSGKAPESAPPSNDANNPFAFVPEKFLKEDKSPDWEKLTGSYIELEKQIGKTRPSAPKDASGYVLDDDFGFELDEERTTVFKDEALKNGISPDQYKWIMGKYANAVGDFLPTREKAETTLKEVWGDDYADNLADANRAYSVFGEGLDPNGLGFNPDALQLLARIGREMDEDQSVKKPTSRDPGMSETEVMDLMKREDYWTNKELQAKVAAFYEARARS